MTTMASVEMISLVRDGAGLIARRSHSRFHPADEHLYRVLRVGVCGTDLQILRGARQDPASVLGHEALLLKTSSEFSTPARAVVVNPVHPDDQDSIIGHSVEGLWRNYLLADPAVFDRLTIDACASLPVDLGPLVEPLGTALYAWEQLRAHVPRSGRVAIIGAGTAATLVAMLGEEGGYHTQLVHPRPDRLDYIDQLNVLSTTTRTSSPSSDHFDGVVTCVPREAAHAALTQALVAVTDGGIIDLFGGLPAHRHHPDLPTLDLAAIRRRNACGRTATSAASIKVADKTVHVTGHRGTAPHHLRLAQRLLCDQPARYQRLITAVLSLTHAQTRIPLMACGIRSSGEHMKLIIDPSLDNTATAWRPVDTGLLIGDLPGGRG
ncbi:hypothetical protein [Nocardia sp. NPDC050435]|uniref:hypothetical protein n=1 Tax=Nocardia sp. NPDC050435 TaxID=3155040 RepID=UPI0033C4B7F4